MADVTRFDPFGESVEQAFRRMLRPFSREFGEPLSDFRVEVKETPENYTVVAEIPGVRKEDIDIAIDGNVVSIRAELKRDKEEKQGEKVIRSERYYGAMARSFTLAQDIDRDKAVARCDNGVLSLTLPKKQGGRTTRISIQ